MPINETIITALRVSGARAYVAAMNSAAYAVENADRKISRIEATSKKVGGALDRVATNVTRFGSRIGVAAAATGLAAAKIGLEFDANIERAEIGIGTLVGNASQAKKIVADVRDFALKAPMFGVEQMTQTAQQLIGVGYDAKNIVPYLQTFSDTLSALGRRPEDLQRMTYAFSQMMSKGQISAEELRGQLGEIFPAQKLLAKEMGITTKELSAKLKAGEIRGRKPLMLLLRGMEKAYGGGTERIAGSFSGMWANIKEQTKYAMGVLFKPLFKELERDVLPSVGRFGEEWVKVLTNNEMSAEDKWKETKELFNTYLRPIWDEFIYYMNEKDIPGLIGGVIDDALPIVAEKGVDLGEKFVAKMFEGWKNADLETQLITAFLLFGRFGLLSTIAGVFGRIGAAAVGAMVASMKTTAAGKEAMAIVAQAGTLIGSALGAAVQAAWLLGLPLLVTFILSELGNEIDRQLGGGNKKLSDLGKAGEPIAESLRTDKSVIDDVKDIISGIKNLNFTGGNPVGPLGHRQSGGTALGSGPYVVGEHGPELAWLPGGSRIDHKVGGEIVLHNYMVMDGRVASKSVARYNADQLARR